MPDVAELLAAYDAQVRDRIPDPLPRGVTVERDGPLVRFLGLAGRGLVVYRDLGGLEGGDLDELIARSSAPRGSGSSAAPNSRPSGVARPCRSGADAGSTELLSPTGRTSPPAAVSATSRRTPRTT